jgi:acyl carrier protein
MTRAEILTAIAEVAARHIGVAAPLRAEMRLVEDLRLDSLKLLTLAVEVENRFRVRLEPEAEAAIRTIGDLVEAVAARLE